MFSFILFVVLWMVSGIPGLMLLNLYRAYVEKEVDVGIFDVNDAGVVSCIFGPIFTVSMLCMWAYDCSILKLYLPKWLKKINFKLS